MLGFGVLTDQLVSLLSERSRTFSRTIALTVKPLLLLGFIPIGPSQGVTSFLAERS